MGVLKYVKRRAHVEDGGGRKRALMLRGTASVKESNDANHVTSMFYFSEVKI